MTQSTQTDPLKLNSPAEMPPKPDPEVLPKPKRKTYTAEYKIKILAEADVCSKPGQIGELLRREGLYSSLLSNWRKQRKDAARNALKAKSRGPKAKDSDPLGEELQQLRQEKEQLANRLRQAQAIIEAQKKISEILSMTPPCEPN